MSAFKGLLARAVVSAAVCSRVDRILGPRGRKRMTDYSVQYRRLQSAILSLQYCRIDFIMNALFCKFSFAI